MSDSPSPVLDVQHVAKRIKAARALSGYRSGGEVVSALAEMGVEVSRRTYYAWENAEWLPPMDAFVALVVVLHPPGGALWFETAMRPDVADAWRVMHAGSE